MSVPTERLLPGDAGYDAVFAEYLANHCARSVRVGEQVYLTFADGETVFFVLVSRDDPAFLDPNDKTGRWHQYYGYKMKE